MELAFERTRADSDASASSLFDLNEDLLAAWVPDVAGGVDFPAYLSGEPAGTGPVFQNLSVPKPGGGTMQIRVLHPGWHAGLHRAVAGLRKRIDVSLSPGVFGYRRGADGTASYSSQWRAFGEYTASQAGDARWVILTDIAQFFPSITWAQVLESVSEIDLEASRPLLRLAPPLERAGLDYPPSGYADARLLANAVLSKVDHQVSVPFSRWVDDYRLFIPNGVDPGEELSVLRRALGDVGLALNEEKTQILPAAQGEEASRNSLASVYHPDRDSSETVRENLHGVFARILEDPVGQRRSVRFLLPRLAEQRDDVAVTFAFHALRTLPWDAPRLVGYLAVFATRPDVSFLIGAHLARAAEDGDGWLVSRLAALACHVPISSNSADVVLANLDRLAGTPAWGLALRVLALAGREEVIGIATAQDAPDPRAAQVALRDLDTTIPTRLQDAEPVLARELRTQAAPRPTVETIL